ncbi:hypothetical protein [Streptomyces silvisoli]|uniref:Uncharacterized protein n=1 Tax=Streptomyces silvisoli TaxID=3034235 RepID=A0ABT5ZX29_9ACTN|nr:hypothetical protein [Streptomyces silvisoli]MDF3294374.1 hypothetical protein [Streptomyces silvisoli]
MADLDPATVLLVKAYALRKDGEDRGELTISFSSLPNPRLLSAFAPPVVDALLTVLRAA